MTNSQTATLHRSVTEVTCRRCRMSFRVAARQSWINGRVGGPADNRDDGVTICAEPGCSVPFWHRGAWQGSPVKVGVYPADVVAHRAAWVADIEAGEAT